MDWLDNIASDIQSVFGPPTNYQALYRTYLELARQSFGAQFIGGRAWPNMDVAWSRLMRDEWARLYHNTYLRSQQNGVSAYAFPQLESAHRAWLTAWETYGTQTDTDELGIPMGDMLARPDRIWDTMQRLAIAMDAMDQDAYNPYDAAAQEVKEAAQKVAPYAIGIGLVGVVAVVAGAFIIYNAAKG